MNKLSQWKIPVRIGEKYNFQDVLTIDLPNLPRMFDIEGHIIQRYYKIRVRLIVSWAKDVYIDLPIHITVAPTAGTQLPPPGQVISQPVYVVVQEQPQPPIIIEPQNVPLQLTRQQSGNGMMSFPSVPKSEYTSTGSSTNATYGYMPSIKEFPKNEPEPPRNNNGIPQLPPGGLFVPNPNGPPGTFIYIMPGDPNYPNSHAAQSYPNTQPTVNTQPNTNIYPSSPPNAYPAGYVPNSLQNSPTVYRNNQTMENTTQPRSQQLSPPVIPKRLAENKPDAWVPEQAPPPSVFYSSQPKDTGPYVSTITPSGSPPKQQVKVDPYAAPPTTFTKK